MARDELRGQSGERQQVSTGNKRPILRLFSFGRAHTEPNCRLRAGDCVPQTLSSAHTSPQTVSRAQSAAHSLRRTVSTCCRAAPREPLARQTPMSAEWAPSSLPIALLLHNLPAAQLAKLGQITSGRRRQRREQEGNGREKEQLLFFLAPLQLAACVWCPVSCKCARQSARHSAARLLRCNASLASLCVCVCGQLINLAPRFAPLSAPFWPIGRRSFAALLFFLLFSRRPAWKRVHEQEGVFLASIRQCDSSSERVWRKVSRSGRRVSFLSGLVLGAFSALSFGPVVAWRRWEFLCLSLASWLLCLFSGRNFGRKNEIKRGRKSAPKARGCKEVQQQSTAAVQK